MVSSQGSPSSAPQKNNTLPFLPQAPCYPLPGYLPRNRWLSRPVAAAKKNNSRNSFFSVIHFAFLSAEHKIPTAAFRLGRAQCWRSSDSSWALTWQCLSFSASLTSRKTSQEAAGTSVSAKPLPPEPCCRVCSAAGPGWGRGTPKAQTRVLADAPSPCRLPRLILLPGKQEADATFRLCDNWMTDGVVAKEGNFVRRNKNFH